MEHLPLNVIGPRVRKIREQLGLTQDQLAARCQVAGGMITRGTLAKIEVQIRAANDYEVHLLSYALRVPMADLFPAKPVNLYRKHANPTGKASKRKRASSPKSKPQEKK